VEAAPGLDRCADNDELGSAFYGEACDVLPEVPRPGADDLPPHTYAVRAGHGGRGLEPLLQTAQLSVEARVERQLAIDEKRRHEHDAGPAIGSQPAGEIERVLGLLTLEQRDDDAPVGDRAGPEREAACAPPERPDVRQLHRSSW
jgi:hypothetical protein